MMDCKGEFRIFFKEVDGLLITRAKSPLKNMLKVPDRLMVMETEYEFAFHHATPVDCSVLSLSRHFSLS